MSLSESITALRTMLDSADKEVKSLEGGKKASSARARKALQNIKGGCHVLRKNITSHQKTMTTKPRTKKLDSACETSQEEAPATPPVKAKRARKTKSKE